MKQDAVIRMWSLGLMMAPRSNIGTRVGSAIVQGDQGRWIGDASLRLFPEAWRLES